jgi:DDE superfamily endonuclease
MPKSTGRERPAEEQAQMLAALRRARYGSLLALHIMLWCAAGRTPPAIAAILFGARSSVYRPMRADRKGPLGWEHDEPGRLVPPARTTGLLPPRRRSLRALLKAPPRAYGGCRTRWSCAPRAATLHATRGMVTSAETMRRWRHELGWGWKRAKLAAKDDDPQRVNRLARRRGVFAQLTRCEAMVVADELASHLFPKVGCAWMPNGSHVTGMTPGQPQQHYLAGALEPTTGTLPHGLGPRKTNARFRARLGRLEVHDPAARYTRLYVVVDHEKIHQAKAVEPWLAAHPRVPRRLLPPYGPQANPIARAFGDVHDLCTRKHTRQRLRDLVADVEAPLHGNGPWLYKLADIYYAPAVAAELEHMTAEEPSTFAA